MEATDTSDGRLRWSSAIPEGFHTIVGVGTHLLPTAVQDNIGPEGAPRELRIFGTPVLEGSAPGRIDPRVGSSGAMPKYDALAQHAVGIQHAVIADSDIIEDDTAGHDVRARAD